MIDIHSMLRNTMEILHDLPSRLKESLEKAGINTLSTIISTPTIDLLGLTDLTLEECDLVKRYVSKSYAENKIYSGCEALHIYRNKWKFLSTGDQTLNDFLGGGYALRGITEIAGESSCGKTQFCLQAALSVQLPESSGGLAAGAAYICTEDTFPSSRLQQLLKLWAIKCKDSVSNLGDNVFIEHIPDAESLKNCVFGRLPTLLRQRRIGLVIVDSIAGAFRADYDEQQGAIERAEEFQSIAMQMYQLANEHHLAVICVNQVTAVPGEGLTAPALVPALGLAWANLVTTRLQLHRSRHMIGNPSGFGPPVALRFMEVVFSPYLPRGRCQFVVTESGVHGVTESAL